MKNKLANLITKDKQVSKTMFLLILAIPALLFLMQCNQKQERTMRRLREERQLVLQLPELEAQQKDLASRAGLSLTGIILGETPTAIINDMVLKTGDEIAGKKIVQIRENSVIISSGQEEVELELK